MKKNTLLLIFTMISFLSIGQDVIRNEQKCLSAYTDVSNIGGKLQVKGYSKDTTYLDFLTYGPCNATMKISVKSLVENNAVDIEVKNIAEQTPDDNCYCMFKLNPVIVGINDPKSKSWVIRNETMSRDVWEKWFWDKL